MDGINFLAFLPQLLLPGTYSELEASHTSTPAPQLAPAFTTSNIPMPALAAALVTRQASALALEMCNITSTSDCTCALVAQQAHVTALANLQQHKHMYLHLQTSKITQNFACTCAIVASEAHITTLAPDANSAITIIPDFLLFLAISYFFSVLLLKLK